MEQAIDVTSGQPQTDLLATEGSFAELLKKSFKPPTDERQRAIEQSMDTLSEWALRNTTLISDDTVESIKGMIGEIDKLLSAQINEIMHNEEFQKVESAWRGLHFLVNRSEINDQLKVRVLQISKTELRNTLRKYKGAAWDTSPLFRKIYENEFGVLGGEPYGCLIGDYAFNHSATDCETLREMSKIAASAHVPFLAAADSSLLGLQSWQELPNPRDLSAIFSTPEYAAWNSLRSSEDSRYLGLALPRFLGRMPYGANTNPVDEFDFEEETGGSDPSKFCWLNAAYAMGTNVTRAYSLYGWCTRIRGVESGGAVENLPIYTFPTDEGGMDMTCPTEISISDRREAELAKNGFMPLIHRKNSDMAAFIGAQSVQKPVVYDDQNATANAELSARLPYMFAVCRFAHYLKAMVRDKIGGTFNTAEELRVYLEDWLRGNYVHAQPALATDEEKAIRPLAAAQVIVTAQVDRPGYYHAQFLLQPHYQLEGLTVSLRLASKLKSEGNE
ncbi:MAG: type VI secretion system contractile sheath large subunit [Polyangiales bacterium]